MNDPKQLLLAAGISRVLAESAYGLGKVRAILCVMAKSPEDRQTILEHINELFAEMVVEAERDVAPRLEADLAVAKAKHTASQETPK